VWYQEPEGLGPHRVGGILAPARGGAVVGLVHHQNIVAAWVVRLALLGQGLPEEGVLSNLVDGGFQAAGVSCFTPSIKTSLRMTSGSSFEPFKARQLFEADSINIYTIVRHARRLPLPFVLA
jgi:hypothetical protein